MTTAPAERPARIAVVYYSARGNVHGLARAVAQTTASDEDTLVVARAQGARLAGVAQVVGAARHAGLLTAKPARSDAADRPGC